MQQDQNELEPIIQSDIDEVNNLMKTIYNSTIRQSSLKDKSFLLQASAALLQDGVQSYQLSNATSSGSSFNTVDYENALGLSSTSMANFEIVADSVNDRRRQEIRSFYNQLIEGISNNQPFDTVASIASAIERDFSEELSLTSGSEIGSEQLQYFSTIRELLSEVVSSANNGDYQAANSAAIKAYLDNYEYLEAPIEKHDPELMLDIEIEMREELRQMISENRPPQEINAFVTTILSKLGEAEELLRNDPTFLSSSSIGDDNNATTASGSMLANIEGLREGFGSYTGEKRQMGEADEPAKQSVRNNIDQIRLKLNEMLRLYSGQNYEGSNRYWTVLIANISL